MRKPTLLTLFLIVFIDLVGFGLVMPLLPYFAKSLGATGTTVGLLFGVFSLAQFLFAPVWGRLSDRVGRRPILLVSLAGSTASYLLLGLSHSLALVFASRLLAGVCAANIAVANAYVADITTKENRSKGMGLIGAAFGIGFILGPVLAAFLGRDGYALPAFAASGISGLSLLLAFFYLPESRVPDSASPTRPEPLFGSYFANWSFVLALPLIGALTAVSFLSNMALSKWETTFALFVHGSPSFGYALREVGLLLGYVGLIVAAMQGGLIGRLVKKWGEAPLLKTGLISTALGLALTPFCTGLGELLLCLTAIGVGMGMLRPVLFGSASILAPAEHQGLVLGVLQGAGSLGRIVGPLLGGWLLDRNPAFPFWTAAIGLLFALALTPPSRNFRTE